MITPSPHHQLFREDTVFLFPKPSYELFRKYVSINIPFLRYYGRLIIPPDGTCSGCRCNQLNLKVLYNYTDIGYCSVRFPLAREPFYIRTKGVIHATGKSANWQLFSSYDVNEMFQNTIGITYPWLSSTIYHVNCSKSRNETFDWFGLSLNVTNEICAFDKYLIQSDGATTFYVLRKPMSSVEYSYLKTLKLVIKDQKNRTEFLSRYGSLKVVSNPRERMCSKMKREEFKNFLIVFMEDIITCATLQSTVELVHELRNSKGQFEIGLQVFEDARVTLTPTEKLFMIETTGSLHLYYKWTYHKERNYFKEDFDKRLKLLNFTSREFSWTMAAAKCNEIGMTLPHLKDAETTRQFVIHVLEKYILPIYVLFIGLMKKVRVP